jgi:hypothetical protein
LDEEGRTRLSSSGKQWLPNRAGHPSGKVWTVNDRKPQAADSVPTLGCRKAMR